MEMMNVFLDFAETGLFCFVFCFCLFFVLFCSVLCSIKIFQFLPNGCLCLAFYFHTRV